MYILYPLDFGRGSAYYPIHTKGAHRAAQEPQEPLHLHGGRVV